MGIFASAVKQIKAVPEDQKLSVEIQSNSTFFFLFICTTSLGTQFATLTIIVHSEQIKY